MSPFINTCAPLVQCARKRPRNTCNTTTSSLISRRDFSSIALATALTAIASAPPFSLHAEPQPGADIDINTGRVQEYRELPSGLVVQDLRLGDGPSPARGSRVRVRWTGRLTDRYGWNYQKEPLEADYMLDDARLIAGFREGVSGMRVHGKRRLFIPPKLGYRTAKELPQPSDFGDKRRLETSVANKRRTIVDGQGDGGHVLIDVELVKIILPK